MSLITRFLKQEATWEELTGSDAYNGNTYAEAETISVRWFTQTERNVSVSGDTENDALTYVSATYISTTTEIKNGDRITDENGTARFVKSVRKNRSAKGSLSHYVAALL